MCGLTLTFSRIRPQRQLAPNRAAAFPALLIGPDMRLEMCSSSSFPSSWDEKQGERSLNRRPGRFLRFSPPACPLCHSGLEPHSHSSDFGKAGRRARKSSRQDSRFKLDSGVKYVSIPFLVTRVTSCTVRVRATVRRLPRQGGLVVL